MSHFKAFILGFLVNVAHGAPCTVNNMGDCSAAELKTIKEKYLERTVQSAKEGTICTINDMSGCGESQLNTIKKQYHERNTEWCEIGS